MIRKRKLLKVLALTAVAAFVVEWLPDVARYLRIREM
jgi:hypothetical protein